jgi:class 3 adenylate cyclase
VGEERKVVTVLFADLVGFTARAELMDPEDVRAVLAPYHVRLRCELERFGGTVEKFIGDAVMALFGAPVAHEDDPERAVRAALAIRDWARDEGAVQVRVAVNTGEALIDLVARPRAGEAVAAGDVVNTTARLQSAAPVNGVLVGESTYRATRAVIEYRDAESVAAKGKAQPVSVWEAMKARARVTTEAVSVATQLVGRGRELTLLRELLVRVREESSSQLVTLVGVPGIGKSRLVHELMGMVEAGGVLTYWRRGRSLPYGEGVTLWALSEIVKAQAGILESDSSEEVGRKLHAAVEALISDRRDAASVETQLLPLVGLGAKGRASGDRREEAFAGWRRFFEGMADQRPLVVVFEDLHWADDELLDFVDYLIDWSTGVPILIVCTARPELLERRGGWGGGKLNATTLSLSPLSDADTGQLLAGLLDRPLLQAEDQQELLARAGGNPLYAEQYAQLIVEGSPSRNLPVPESVQGIIAARLDRLPPIEKRLLQEASVLGKLFWLGAVANGRTQVELEKGLHALERMGFVQRARTSSVADQAEYTFLHLLVRDVAYGQIPRADRAEAHRRAADWIESLGRTEDHAEMLAHHYVRALELSRAAGAEIGDLANRARHAFRAAGDRAHALNAFPAAAGLYREALELWPPDDPERPGLLLRLGESLYLAGADDAVAVLAQTSAAFEAADENEYAAEAEVLLAELWWYRGDGDRCATHIERTQVLLEGQSASPARARALSVVSRYRMLAEDNAGAIATGREALALAEALGLDDLTASSLISVGTARAAEGDPGGVDDIKRGAQIAESVRASEAARGYNNLSYVLEFSGDLAGARDAWANGREWAERAGSAPLLRFITATFSAWAWLEGDWDTALRIADEFIAECEAGAASPLEPNVHVTRSFIRLARADAENAFEDAQRAVELTHHEEDPELQLIALQGLLLVQLETDRVPEAQVTARELLNHERTVKVHPALFTLAFAAERLRLKSDVQTKVDRLQIPTRWSEASSAILANDFAAAADIFAKMGARPHEALTRFRAAQALVANDQRVEANAQLQSALAFWRSVGATRYVRKSERLLAASP